ncbi:MAG: gliding motility-associated C-terminal domain-containing protein [Mucilaginibacter sp.]
MIFKYSFKALLAITAAIIFNSFNTSFAQVTVQPPQFTYTTPDTYTVNTLISSLIPNNTGGAVPATLFGDVSTFAGQDFTQGHLDATGTNALFNRLWGIDMDATGNLYVGDGVYIRKITPAGVVTTLAGGNRNNFSDGTGTAAGFSLVSGLSVAPSGNIVAGDRGNKELRQVTPTGVVTTINTSSIFNFNPAGVATDQAGNIFVTDQANDLITEISPTGTITPFAGSIGFAGFRNGPVASSVFNQPTDLKFDRAGNLFIADDGNNMIREISAAGATTTVAGSTNPGLVNGPVVTALFNKPLALAVDLAENIYVSDANGLVLRMIDAHGQVISIAGSNARKRSSDGIGGAASFDQMSGMVYSNGMLFIADATCVRKVIVTGYTIDKPLPLGLIFDSTTGIISGTPLVASPTTQYTITGYNTGGSSSTIVTITVDPLTFNPQITASTATGTIFGCAGSPSSSPNLQQFTFSGSGLTGNVTATAPAGFEISLTENSGYGGSLVFPESAGIVNNITIYVRSAASDNQNISGNVVLSSPGATDQDVAVAATVSIVPTVDPVPNMVINNGSATAPVNFTGNGTVSWSNDNISIGLGASGYGNIPSFIATNNTNSPVVATITVTPMQMAASYCLVTPITFTITVNPLVVPPSISYSAALAELATTYGTASVSESFTVTGINVTNGILVTPPTGFEVSTDNTNFNSSVVVGTTGNFTSLPVYIRLAKTTPVGSYSGNIALSSAGATDVDIPMPNSVVNKALLTITADNQIKAQGTPNPPLTISFEGFVNNDTRTDLTTQPVATTLATTNSAIGEYPINVSGATSPNYDILQLSGILTITPGIVQVPNAFTPNGDGVNDIWNIKELTSYPACIVSIYNRYGGLIYESKGYSKPWDGTYNGSPAPEGTYYYIINLQNGLKPLSGYVSIIR